jgi:hypothetical protein
MPKRHFRKKKARYNLLKLLGPGLVTGASDDDPSGIATYSQVGAKFGFGMLWTMPVSYPIMAAVQEISARMGRVTGRGLAGNMRRFYSAWITLPLGAVIWDMGSYEEHSRKPSQFLHENSAHNLIPMHASGQQPHCRQESRATQIDSHKPG